MEKELKEILEQYFSWREVDRVSASDVASQSLVVELKAYFGGMRVKE